MPKGRSKKKMSDGQKALKLVKKISVELKPEVKYFETSDSAQCGYDSPQINLISQIVRGDDYDDRTGIVVRPQKLNVRYIISSQDGSNSYAVRVMVVQSLAGANLTAMNTLLDPILSNRWDLAFRDKNNTDQFRMLYDKVFVSGVNNSLDNEYIFRTINLDFSKLRGAKKTIKWQEGDTTGGSFVHGQLYLVFITNQTDAAGAPVCSYQTRLTYTDV